jgi:hypothetical protein
MGILIDRWIRNGEEEICGGIGYFNVLYQLSPRRTEDNPKSCHNSWSLVT